MAERRSFTQSDYILANQTLVLVGELGANGALPTAVTITTDSTTIITAGAETLSLTADSSTQVRDGQVFEFGGVPVRFAEDVVIGTTATPVAVYATTADISAASTGQLFGGTLYPIYSVNQANTQIGEQSTQSQNFSKNNWSSQSVTERNWQMSLQGEVVGDDNGERVLRLYSRYTETQALVYVELHEPLPDVSKGLADWGFASVTGYNRNRQRGNRISISWNFLGDGELKALVDYGFAS